MTFLYGGHVRANGIRQHYLRFGGRGRPVVVVPGITSPAATWSFVGRKLGEFCDAYVIDIRGRGLSEGGPALKYTLDDYAKDIAELTSRLNLNDAAILGHSMGGRIAARLGRCFPDRLSRLSIIDPPLSGPGRRPYVRPLDFYLAPIAQARRGEYDVETARETYPKWSEENLRLRVEWLHTCDDTAIAESVRGFQEEEIHGDLASLALPVQLVVAGKGGVITTDDIEELLRLRPGLLVRRIEHTGHMIPFEDLAAFLDAVQSFLLDG